MLTSLLVAFALAGGQQADATPGQLIGIPDKEGRPAVVMPLKHTAVVADVAGIASRVTVTQTFTNPSPTPIEAIYTFPLPADAAVDRMRIKVGERIVEGEIKRAEEARMIYEAAKNAGMTAALLDQERPNIFTQSIANIMPGTTVQVEISYVDMLKYENGEFEFSFPMVVGPRNTMNAPDPEQISPPITPKGTRTGHDVSLTVHLDAGMSLRSVESKLHAIKMEKRGAGKYEVTLSGKGEIPNRDFILNWIPAGTGVTEGLIAHNGTFCLTVLPPRSDVELFASPREVIFVMDQSGSQQGFPIEKSKELTIAMIDKLRANDVFNVVTFTTGVNKLWPESMPYNPQRVREAEEFIKGLQAGGGTNFLPPLTATMTHKALDGRLKLIVFNTDGYVGDDFDILQMVQNNRLNARLFTFGIGNSVNRFLIDGMSFEGRGASEIVTLASDVGPAIERFLRRTQTPVLTDVEIDFKGASVREVTPEVVPDLFSDSPLVVFGKYSGVGPAKVTIAGNLGGQPWTRTIDVVFPANSTGSNGIDKMWARKRLDDMVRKDYYAATASTRGGKTYERDNERLVQFALANGIMSQWTSFVAVEKRVVNFRGRQRTVRVPVEMADGVSMDVVLFGYPDGLYRPARNDHRLALGAVSNIQSGGTFRGGQGGGGFGGGFGGGGAGGGANKGGGSTGGTSTGGGAAAMTGAGSVLSKEDQAKMKAEEERRTLDETARQRKLLLEKLRTNPELKIDSVLKKSTQKNLEVAVALFEMPLNWRYVLSQLGLQIAVTLDDVKVVYGTIDKDKLMDLARIGFVMAIHPIEE